MYYDGNTGQYLSYDEETKTYKYHSAEGVEMTYTNSEATVANSSSQKKKSKKRREKQKVLFCKLNL